MIGQKLTNSRINFSLINNENDNDNDDDKKITTTIINNNNSFKNKNIYNEYKIDLKQATERPINLVKFCQFDNANDILACCVRERIFIYRILFSSNDNKDEFNYQFIYDYICGSKCSTITFGPKTNFSLKNNNGFLNIAIATDDYCILLLNQLINYNNNNDNDENRNQMIKSLNENVEQNFLTGHINHINDLAFEPINGEQLASTSDDCTCIIRTLNNDKDKMIKIMLSSPGINVKWHRTEPNKLLVAEKKGIIRFYDTITRIAVMSFDCNQYPLTSCDWCIDNNLFIGCTSNHNIYFWDTSLTSLPIKILKTNYEGLSEFSFYDNKLIAYRSRPYSNLFVKNFLTNQTFIEKNLIAGHGISWNRSMPLLAVGGPKYIHLFKFDIF